MEELLARQAAREKKTQRNSSCKAKCDAKHTPGKYYNAARKSYPNSIIQNRTSTQREIGS